MSDKNIFEASDDEFGQMSGPPAAEAPPPAPEPAPAPAEPPAPETSPEPETRLAEPPQEDKPADKAPANPDPSDDELGSAPPATEEKKPEPPPADKPQDKAPEPPKDQPAPVDYEQTYRAALAPLKANGKDFAIKSVDELRRLAQKGIGAERFMESIAPDRRLMEMAKRGGIFDEQKLAFAIDLLAGNKEAVKKLVKDSNIDLLDVDMSTPANYAASHQAPDAANIAFNDALRDMKSLEGGQETINAIHEHWDDKSKDALFEKPALLEMMHSHRELGVYGRIHEEMNRQRTLGTLDKALPFLDAYKKVGDEIQARNGFDDLPAFQAPAPAQPPAQQAQPPQQPAPPPAPEPRRLATVVETPKSPVQNNDKAKAAAPVRSTPGQGKTVKNPFEMSDDDIGKMAPPPAA